MSDVPNANRANRAANRANLNAQEANQDNDRAAANRQDYAQQANAQEQNDQAYRGAQSEAQICANENNRAGQNQLLAARGAVGAQATQQGAIPSRQPAAAERAEDADQAEQEKEQDANAFQKRV